MNIFQRYLVEGAEDYQEGHLSRRERLFNHRGDRKPATGEIDPAACTPRISQLPLLPLNPLHCRRIPQSLQ
jgi:hypothetical protein